MTDLAPFRTAPKLSWRSLSVFAPHRGDDGNLITGTDSMPLDTWLPAKHRTSNTLTDDGVGIAVVDPATVEDTHAAVRAWCLEFLGRSDVRFDDCGTAEEA